MTELIDLLKGLKQTSMFDAFDAPEESAALPAAPKPVAQEAPAASPTVITGTSTTASGKPVYHDEGLKNLHAQYHAAKTAGDTKAAEQHGSNLYDKMYTHVVDNHNHLDAQGHYEAAAIHQAAADHAPDSSSSNFHGLLSMMHRNQGEHLSSIPVEKSYWAHQRYERHDLWKGMNIEKAEATVEANRNERVSTPKPAPAPKAPVTEATRVMPGTPKPAPAPVPASEATTKIQAPGHTLPSKAANLTTINPAHDAPTRVGNPAAPKPAAPAAAPAAPSKPLSLAESSRKARSMSQDYYKAAGSGKQHMGNNAAAANAHMDVLDKWGRHGAAAPAALDNHLEAHHQQHLLYHLGNHSSLANRHSEGIAQAPRNHPKLAEAHQKAAIAHSDTAGLLARASNVGMSGGLHALAAYHSSKAMSHQRMANAISRGESPGEIKTSDLPSDAMARKTNHPKAHLKNAEIHLAHAEGLSGEGSGAAKAYHQERARQSIKSAFEALRGHYGDNRRAIHEFYNHANHASKTAHTTQAPYHHALAAAVTRHLSNAVGGLLKDNDTAKMLRQHADVHDEFANSAREPKEAQKSFDDFLTEEMTLKKSDEGANTEKPLNLPIIVGQPKLVDYDRGQDEGIAQNIKDGTYHVPPMQNFRAQAEAAQGNK